MATKATKSTQMMPRSTPPTTFDFRPRAKAIPKAHSSLWICAIIASHIRYTANNTGVTVSEIKNTSLMNLLHAFKQEIPTIIRERGWMWSSKLEGRLDDSIDALLATNPVETWDIPNLSMQVANLWRAGILGHRKRPNDTGDRRVAAVDRANPEYWVYEYTLKSNVEVQIVWYNLFEYLISNPLVALHGYSYRDALTAALVDLSTEGTVFTYKQLIEHRFVALYCNMAKDTIKIKNNTSVILSHLQHEEVLRCTRGNDLTMYWQLQEAGIKSLKAHLARYPKIQELLELQSGKPIQMIVFEPSAVSDPQPFEQE